MRNRWRRKYDKDDDFMTMMILILIVTKVVMTLEVAIIYIFNGFPKIVMIN